MKKSLKTFLRLFVGLGILGILVYKVGLSRIIGVFSGLDLRFILPILLLVLMTVAFAALNIAILLIPLNRYIPVKKILRYYVVSFSLGSFVPGKLGELAIVYFLNKEKIPIGQATAVSIIDKLITVFTLVMLSSLSLFIYFAWDVVIALVVILVAGASFTYFFLIWEPGRRFIRERILKGYHHLFKGFSSTLQDILKNNRPVLYGNLVLTLIKWVIHASAFVLLFKGFGITVPFWPVLSITAITTLAALIPITMNGIGLREAVAVFLYAKINILPEYVVSAYIFFTVLNYLLASSFIVLFWKDIAGLTAAIKEKVKNPARKKA